MLSLLVPNACTLPRLREWQITLIVIGVPALVVSIVVTITVIVVSWHRMGELYQISHKYHTHAWLIPL